MAISYFKRFKMETELEWIPSVPALPPGYQWAAWDDSLLDSHAEVKFRCFQDELDSTVFASLACMDGCRRLMREICNKPGFLPWATWLIEGPDGYCATVQGVGERSFLGAIQNLGVVPGHRGNGIGQTLLLQALHGFRRAGLSRAYLEVTADNHAAIRLYRRVGFRCRKTVYKAVETAEVGKELRLSGT